MSEASLEGRVARVEGILEQMDKRLNHIEGDVKSLDAKIVALEEKMSRNIGALDEKTDKNFRWTLGILIPMWVTTILAILFT